MPQIVADAVLFDLDGTLVDSTASVERNWRKLADRIGRPWAEIRPLIHGVPVRQVMRGLDPTMPDAEVEELQQFMVEGESADVDDVVALPGALAALDALPTARWAIVTSGGDRLAHARIRAAGLPLPRYLVTADDVTLGKPHPEPFLAGARLLGFPPQRCVVFEDAEPGVRAGLAAGATVIGVLTTHAELPVPSVANLAAVQFFVDRSGVTITY